MQTYHRTPHGEAILHNGFRDSSGRFGTDLEWSGVWLADRPVDGNEGASGDDVLVVEIPDATFREYEWIQPGQTYREALVPASVVNLYPRALVDS